MPRFMLAASLALALLVAACGASGPDSGAPSGGASGPGGEASASMPGSTAPGDVSSQPPSESPSAAVSPDPGGSGGPLSSSGPATAADACTGSQTNHQFFVNAALALPWPVLCAVLPTGWFVDSGNYHLASGGSFKISYKGPGGATIALSEGAFCQDPGGCVPPGTDAGDAAFGAQTGTFVRLDDGDFAIVVDRGAAISWLYVAHGLDEATAKTLGAALYQVAH